jgi:hypothetical protein
MFQDEARFGRMVRPRRCWAPTPLRPVISNGYERQFVYVYGAVSPLQGELDWRLCREMNTVRIERVSPASQPGPSDGSHRDGTGRSQFAQSQGTRHPRQHPAAGVATLCPELNPQEHVWDEVREKEFPNRVFNHLDAVIRQLEQGLPRLAAAAERLRSLTAWPWIISLNLNAN